MRSQGNRGKKMPVRNSNGTAAVEFGLILPILVFLVIGTIEFGFILYDKAVITNASREGARAGIVFRNPAITSAEIETVVDNYSTDHLVSLGSAQSITKTVTGDCSVPDNSVTVQVNYPYDFLVLPNFMSGLLGMVNLQAETVMQCENRS